MMWAGVDRRRVRVGDAFMVGGGFAVILIVGDNGWHWAMLQNRETFYCNSEVVKQGRKALGLLAEEV